MGIFDFLTGKKGPISQDQLRQWSAQYASRKESSPGTAALAAGQYGKAIKEFTTQINFGTKKEEGYLLRSLSHSLKGDPGSGLKDAQEAIKINQNNSEAFLVRGFAYVQKNDVNEALKDFKKAVALDLHGRARYQMSGLRISSAVSVELTENPAVSKGVAGTHEGAPKKK